MTKQSEKENDYEFVTPPELKLDRSPNWIDVLPYFIPTVFVVISPILYYTYENLFIPLWIGYGVIPILDYIIPKDKANVTKRVEKEFENDWRFIIPLYVMFVSDIFVYFWTVFLITSGEITTWKTTILAAVNCAHANGLTGLMGHEFIHKKSGIHKFFGAVTLCKFAYGHFVTEHCLGHHINVGTPEDPATALEGESFYQFVYRSSIGGFIKSFNRECDRLIRRNKSPYSLENTVIFSSLCEILWVILMYVLFGNKMIIFHIVYFIIPIVLLEGANYVEHYGIVRIKEDKVHYEAINHYHSWNAPHRISSYVFFRLQRHSDHHVHSYRPYQTLRSYDESPVLPFGYESCIPLAFFPSIWKKVIDPRLKALKEHKKLDKQTENESNAIGKRYCLNFI